MTKEGSFAKRVGMETGDPAHVVRKGATEA